MKVLIECGLVEARKCRTWNYYKICNESAKELIKFIKSITKKDNDINGSEIEQYQKTSAIAGVFIIYS